MSLSEGARTRIDEKLRQMQGLALAWVRTASVPVYAVQHIDSLLYTSALVI